MNQRGPLFIKEEKLENKLLVVFLFSRELEKPKHMFKVNTTW
jgi:hypothetical protein